MNVNAIIARLQEAGTPFKQVGGAVEFDLAVKALTAFPAVFVIPGEEVAAKNERQGPGAVYQRIEAPVAFVIVVRDVKDPARAGAIDPMDVARRFVRSKILGWKAPGDAADDLDYFEFTAGSVAGTKDGFYWWQDDYRTTYSVAAP